MIKQLFLITMLLFGAHFVFAQQTIEELKAKKAELKASLAEKQGEVGALEGELAGIQQEIDILSGWLTGFSGTIGFDFNQSNNWAASPNPDASATSLNVGLTAFANQEGRKHFWRNKGIVTKSWQDIDLNNGDTDDDDLFDNGTVDILNISSLAGYKLKDWLALSGLGELNSSIENFLDPGTVDIGIGATLTPIENLVVVVHPLNYHFAFSGLDSLDSTGAVGAKLRADYTKKLIVKDMAFNFSSTFTTFIPYQDEKMTVTLNDRTFETGLFNYTWLNTISFSIWKGIGVAVSGGIRQANFEFDGTQSYYSVGLSYTL
ncbi:MAG: DUF3078 domain-containing protein [Bacteroidota bacterium]